MDQKGGRWSMYGYISTYSRLQKENVSQLWVLNIGHFNFCFHSVRSEWCFWAKSTQRIISGLNFNLLLVIHSTSHYITSLFFSNHNSNHNHNIRTQTKRTSNMFWSLFSGHLTWKPASTVCNNQQGDLLYSAGHTGTSVSHSQHGEKPREVVEKYGWMGWKGRN